MTTPTVALENGVWVLRLPQVNGKVHEYRCATEAQARQLAWVLAGNASLPS